MFVSFEFLRYSFTLFFKVVVQSLVFILILYQLRFVSSSWWAHEMRSKIVISNSEPINIWVSFNDIIFSSSRLLVSKLVKSCQTCVCLAGFVKVNLYMGPWALAGDWKLS